MKQKTIPVTGKKRPTLYCPLPRVLLGSGIPSTALVLYAMLLDRCTLSQRNGYVDDRGWVFVIYPQTELACDLGISQTMVKKHLKRLEQEGLLIRDRQYRREACRLFPLVPEEALTETGTVTGEETTTETISPSDRRKSSYNPGNTVPPINHKKQPKKEQPYQQHQHYCFEEGSL